MLSMTAERFEQIRQSILEQQRLADSARVALFESQNEQPIQFAKVDDLMFYLDSLQ